MDLPGGIYPNYPGVYFRDEVLAGPSPLFDEISMRGVVRPDEERMFIGGNSEILSR